MSHSYNYETDTFRRRINDASRLVAAAPDARICRVWKHRNGFDVTWHRVLAWSAPIERGQYPIPLTADGWQGEPINHIMLIEDLGGLVLAGYGTFATPEEVIEALRNGELEVEEPRGDTDE